MNNTRSVEAQRLCLAWSQTRQPAETGVKLGLWRSGRGLRERYKSRRGLRVGCKSGHRGSGCAATFRAATYLFGTCLLTYKTGENRKCKESIKESNIQQWDFLGDPAVTNLPSHAEDTGWIPGQEN